MKYTDIKTFENACGAVGVSPDILPGLGFLPAKYKETITAYYKLLIITEALNDGKVADWSDKTELKYSVVLILGQGETDKSKVFYHAVYASYTTVCPKSMIVFKSREIADHFATHFADLLAEFTVNSGF